MYRRVCARGQVERVMSGGFGSDLRRIHCVRTAVHDPFADSVLRVTRRIIATVKPTIVRLVLGEKEIGRLIEHNPTFTVCALSQLNNCGRTRTALHPWLWLATSPGPCVTEPQSGQHMYSRLFGTTVVDGDASQDVLNIRLRVLNNYVEIASALEHTSIGQLELAIVLAAPAVFVDQL